MVGTSKSDGGDLYDDIKTNTQVQDTVQAVEKDNKWVKLSSFFWEKFKLEISSAN